MKPPHAPVSAARRIPAGFRRFLRLSAVVAAAVLSPTVAIAVVNPPHVHSDTPGGSAVSPEVAAAQRKVADLEKQLHELQVQMGNLMATEPQDPGPNATEAQRKKYRQDHAKWQSQVDKVQHQIDSVNQQLAVARKNLEALQPH